MFRVLTVAGLSLVFALGAAQPADAQGWGDRLKRKVKQNVDQRADQAAERAVDKTLDKAEETIKCAATDQACIDRAEAEGKSVEVTDATGAEDPAGASAPSAGNAAADASAPPASASAAAPPAKPGEGAWLNYDFVPGTQALFVDDFTKDNVGDFPRRLEFKSGNMEVAEWNGGRYLRGTTHPSAFYIPLAEALPERFTVEFDAATGPYGQWLTVHFAEQPENHVQLRNVHQIEGGVGGHKVNALGRTKQKYEVGELVPVRIMVDGSYVKVYVAETRVANVPNASLGRSNKILVAMPGDEETPAFLGNIRLMAGGRKLYDALAENGRVATQGILFDTGSDRLRPESTPTLKEIAAMLKEHADLKLTIEGHTDNVGDAAANQTLSEKRAEAVKAYLVSDHGIDAIRLQSKGFGATKPAGSNDTPEGRQTNRRVELVKM